MDFDNEIPYVFDVVTDGDDAVDVAWDLASGQADVEADAIDWQELENGPEGAEETLWLEEVTAP